MNSGVLEALHSNSDLAHSSLTVTAVLSVLLKNKSGAYSVSKCL